MISVRGIKSCDPDSLTYDREYVHFTFGQFRPSLGLVTSADMMDDVLVLQRGKLGWSGGGRTMGGEGQLLLRERKTTIAS